MLQFSKFKVTLILAVLLAGLYTAPPNVFSAAHIDKLPAWLPARTVSLGLDLQGGSHLLYEVDTAALVGGKLDAVEDEIRGALRQQKLGYTDLSVKNDRVTLKLRDLGAIESARQTLTKATVRHAARHRERRQRRCLFHRHGPQPKSRRTAVEQSIEIINKRIDETGTKEPTIIRQGDDRIVVQVPGFGRSAAPQRIDRQDREDGIQDGRRDR